MRAAVIIPVHNRREVTLRCLHTLHSPQLPEGFGVIVVDDGSTDGTGAAVSSAFPEVIIEQGHGQLYWTGGIVRGMRRALTQGAKFIFWLNDDCLPEAEALPRMLAYLHANPQTICGASCSVKGGSQPAETGFRNRRRMAAGVGVTDVDGLSGFCVGMPATVCADIGFPDADRLPHYGADGIYTLNAKRKGYRIVLLEEARVKLLDEKTVQTLDDRMHCSRLRWLPFVRETFFARKSPFFLTSQYWYHRYKYGFLLGGVLFTVKCLRWSWMLVFSFSRRSLPPVPETVGPK